MLDAIIWGSLKQRLVVVVSALAMLVSGVYVVFQMPVDVFPDLTAPTVTVMTESHGMAPEEVEQLVTLPVEAAVNGATGVRRVRSSTARGISIVWVEFDWGMDIFKARQIVSEKLQLVSERLPASVGQPVMAPITSIMGEIMLISVSSDRHSEMEVRTAADWDIRRRLLSLPGVAQVIPIGGGQKQYQIRVDPNKLQAYKITLDQVLTATEQANQSFSGGFFRQYSQEYTIRGIGRTYSLEALEESVITERNHLPVTLGDVAEVTVAARQKIGTASVNASPAVIISIQKQPGANTLDLTDRVDATLAQIESGLPAGYTIDTHIFRQADFIELAVGNVAEALRDGAILVIIVLLLFLANWRTTVISLTAIPLSLISAIFVLEFFDITINTMTLGGMAIAIGAIVDDAIIDVENVFKRLRQNAQRPEPERRPPMEVIFDASKEIRSSIINATLIIMIVFLPLFFLSGIEGRLLQPLGLAYIVSIGASLIVALTVTPALCSYLLSQQAAMGNLRQSKVSMYLQSGYKSVLDTVLAHRKIVLAGALTLFLVTVAVIPFLGRSFLPEFNEGTLTISAVTVPGTSLEESDAIGTRIENLLLQHPAISSTSRRTGRAELDEHAQGVNSSEIDANFTLPEHLSKNTMLAQLREALSAIPGTNITIGQPIGHRIDHMLSGTRANIAVKVFGDDLYQLRTLAQEVRNEMEDVTGVVDLMVEQQQNVPQIQILPNRQAMARYGLTVGELAELIDVAFAGEVVSQILEEGKMFDLVVRFDEAHRGSIEAIQSTIVTLDNGNVVPLQELASIRSRSGPNIISRENVQRKIVVSANVADRDLRGTVEDIQNRINADISVPQGYFVEYGGQFESEARASRIISLLSVVAILGIYLLLYLEFSSLKTALLVMVNLPLALIGGVFTVLLTDGIITIASLVGFITLFGIATRNGILMVSHFQYLLNEGKAFTEAIREGALERLNPILMTALTAGLALIPLALAAGEPGNEIQSPLAQVVIGGLVTSTLLTLIVIPALFAQFEQ